MNKFKRIFLYFIKQFVIMSFYSELILLVCKKCTRYSMVNIIVDANNPHTNMNTAGFTSTKLAVKNAPV